MEAFSRRESALLGSDPQNAIVNTSYRRNSDIDFNDVFGGPPRRSSLQEVRRSVTESEDSGLSPSLWSEKPVFGEEIRSRRRHGSHHFFDDIFRGNESPCSSPRKHDMDPFASDSGSRVLSPGPPPPPPLALTAEPFGGSLPAQFSLPAQRIDLPPFDSTNLRLYKTKDKASNAATFIKSRPFNEANNDNEELRTGDQSSFPGTVSSHESSFIGNEQPSIMEKNDISDMGCEVKEDLINSDVPNKHGNFHFSIYKWASKGVPIVMSLRKSNSSRFKGSLQTEKSSNTLSESMVEEEVRVITTSLDVDFSSDHRVSKNMNAFVVVEEKQEDKYSPLDALHQNGEAIPVVVGFCGESEKEISVTSEAEKPDFKPRSYLSNNVNNQQVQGGDNVKDTSKGSKAKSISKSSVNLEASSMKKSDAKETALDNEQAAKVTIRDLTMKSGDLGKNRVKDKVKEFAKIFNHEASGKISSDIKSQSQRYRWKSRDTITAETTPNKTRAGDKADIANEHYKETLSQTHFLLDESNQPSRNGNTSIRNSSNVFTGSSRQKDSSESRDAMISDDSKAINGDTDECFQVDFVVKELTQSGSELSQANNDQNGIQLIDAKIRKWSSGKEGNIRSLLSTLQYVLWPESGWKPVALVDIIEGNAVKRSYQRALLSLHPDKLQQKGAASHHKYTAEKVFDILQEAWTHFNALGSF